jgi:hypothetical protein
MEINLFVFKSNTIYCGIISVNRTGTTKFVRFLINYIKCEDTFEATKDRFLPNVPTA